MKFYALPITELDQVINRWLVHSGFEVHRAPRNMGRIQLRISRLGESGLILLTPRSALATEVSVRHDGDAATDAFALTDLWAHIAGYIRTPSVEIKAPSQGIPTAILSRIESVVCIKALHRGADIQLSGFMVDAEGLIVCTAHDLKGLKAVTVIFYDDRKMKGRVVKTDPHRDLALIHVDAGFESFIPLDRGRNLLGMGERLYSVGCPVDLKGTIFAGIINGPPRRVLELPLWQVNMEIYPGSSGSPVFDVQGNLVAVVKGRYRGTDSVGFLIPFETLIAFLKET